MMLSIKFTTFLANLRRCDRRHPLNGFQCHKMVSLQSLTVLLLLQTILLQPDSLDTDESSCFTWGKVTNLIHAALTHVVQLLSLRASSKNGEIALVDSASDLAVDSLLRGDDGALQELTLGGEVKTVVQNLGVVESNELITESANFSVKDETLEVDVGVSETGETRGFVASSRFETDESI